MEITSSDVFCDFLEISQHHADPHEPFGASIGTTYDTETGEGRSIVSFKTIKGDHGSSVQLRSDGHRVTFSGNPSRWNRHDNFIGHDLGRCKKIVNTILKANGLPPFTGGDTIRTWENDKRRFVRGYTGASISRIDMTTNVTTGSATAKRQWLNHQQTQTFPRLKTSIDDGNVVYGKYSKSRKFTLYDKSKQLYATQLKRSSDPQYLRQLIEYADALGVVRIEACLKNTLKRDRSWY